MPDRSISEFITRIERLQMRGEQKQQWIAWLREYHTPGYYNRIPDSTRGAKFAYNHLQNPDLLLWLIKAAGLSDLRYTAAKEAALGIPTLSGQSGRIRHEVPWDDVAATLWPSGK